MALIDRVQERITADVLVKLTNPDESNTTTVDTTYLQLVCDDVESEFVAWLNEEYVETIRVLVSAACLLVRYKLIQYGAAPGKAELALMERLEKMVERIRMVRARDRISPQTSSDLTPSTEVQAGETVRPNFDDIFFEDMTPESQGAPDPDLD
jgi:phage gp36-like protein